MRNLLKRISALLLCLLLVLSLPVTAQMKDALRAKILKSMLMEVAHKGATAQP